MVEFPTFERELLQYLPTVIHDVAELQAIMEAEQPEIVRLWEAADRVMCEQFIDTMSEYGIARWEKIIGIKPQAWDTLEKRKARILLILRMRLPYTIRWLRQWLDENCGAGNYTLGIDRYTIQCELHYDRLDEREIVVYDVLDLLGWVRPANMVLGITGQREISGSVSIATWQEQEIELEIGTNPAMVRGGVFISGFNEVQVNISI
jgi:uncharacterized protein YmfQ (DUF2313 family)